MTLGRLVREPLFLSTVLIWVPSAAFWTVAGIPRQFDRPLEVALRGSTAAGHLEAPSAAA